MERKITNSIKKKKKERKPPACIDLAQEYPSPTVALKLHCEQFWTFIVIVTFDLLRTLLRMRAYEQDNYV